LAVVVDGCVGPELVVVKRNSQGRMQEPLVILVKAVGFLLSSMAVLSSCLFQGAIVKNIEQCA
jgi:hypothetical protein